MGKQVAEVIAQALVNAGVRWVFGLPGGEVVELVEALRRAGLRFILTHHESTAAYAAGVTGQLTDSPGVCLTTLGPGVVNLVAGIAQAQLDRTPLLALTGQRQRDICDTLPHQRVDALRLLQPLTKWQCRLSPENTGEAVARALHTAAQEPPGPVHLELPRDVATAEAVEQTFPSPQPYAHPQMNPGALREAIQLIEHSSRPVLLVGVGAQHWQAEPYLRKLAETLGAPVITTPKAKGTFPEDHPLALGVTDACGWQGLRAMLRQADLFVLIGCDPVELYQPWDFATPVLHIGVSPDGEHYFPSGPTLVGESLEHLAALVSPRQSWPPATLREHTDWFESVLNPPSQDLTPHRVLRTLQDLVPPETVVCCDVGAHKQLAGQLWRSPQPKTFLVSNGLSAMGTALPAALAARLVFPDRPVVCLIGDGGFKMVQAELETLVREELPLVVIVFADQALSLIRLAQEAKGFPSTGVDYHPVDFAGIATASGARGFRLEKPEECVPILQQALECGAPAVVDARVSAQFYPSQCRA